MERICKIISELSPKASYRLVKNTLGPVIEEEIVKKQQGSISSDSADEGERVSPLMIACDKSQLHCLQFFVEILENSNKQNVPCLFNLLGQPCSPSPDSKNRAIHYAVMSGCGECALYIAKMLKLSNGYECTHASMFDFLLNVLSQKNVNGDTAFMMASFQGDNKMLEEWFDSLLLFAKNEKHFDFDGIRKALLDQNKAGSSCLSLACGHGHFKVVESLIKERINGDLGADNFVLVSHNHVKQAEKVVKKTSAILSMLNNDDKGCPREIFACKSKVLSTQRCLVMLQISTAKLAEKRSDELMRSETERRKLEEGKDKKNRDKKKTYKAIETKEALTLSKMTANNKDMENEIKIIDPAVPFFKTLEDGTIVNNSYRDSPQCPKGLEYKSSDKHHYEIQNLLKERCIQSSSENDDSVSVMMESLCLDASMLLLSPHRMAMELSPSQLDVIEKVLSTQFNAVAEARKIHQRLMSHMKGENEQ